jgi:hypothetical protein
VRDTVVAGGIKSVDALEEGVWVWVCQTIRCETSEETDVKRASNMEAAAAETVP